MRINRCNEPLSYFSIKTVKCGCLFCIQNHRKELVIYQINIETTEIC
nr:MAG TPA: hypothetical protein [Caudoviricetes sp.]